MRSGFVCVATSLASSIAFAVACHQQRPSRAPDANHLFSEYCWWSVNRSLLPPDSVAVHFANAYTAIGFTNAQWTHLADTSWAEAGPTSIRPDEPGVAYRAWAVAYRAADSTRYRYFVASIGRPPSKPIPLCISIANHAALHGVQLPRPTGEETLSVWRRRP